MCDALLTPQPLGPLHDIATETGDALRELLRGDPVPYAVATALLDELRRAGPTIVVIEDIHWADEATLDVIRLVARRIETVRTVIAVSCRDEELDARHLVRLMLGELASASSPPRTAVTPSPAVARLAEPFGIDLEELHRTTAGNAFFVTEVLASGGTAIPATARAVLAQRADSRPKHETLDAVAVAPPHAETWLVEALPVPSTRDSTSASPRVLVSVDGNISFRHELARLSIEGSILATRTRGLHRLALEALLERRSGDRTARLAHHADAAGEREAVLGLAPSPPTTPPAGHTVRRPTTWRGRSATRTPWPPTSSRGY
jgi:hypothetical protein